MFDHILCYPTGAARPAGPLDEAGQPMGYPSWDDDAGRTWMPVRCILADAVYDGATGEIVTPAVHAPGAWMVVRTVERDPELEADPLCLIVADEERAAKGEPYVLVCKLNPETLLGRIEPTFSGDGYLFPSGPARDLSPYMATD